MNRKHYALILSLAVLFCMTSAFAQTVVYNYETIDYPKDKFTQLLGINNSGDIAGYHNFNDNKGFTYNLTSKKFVVENYPKSVSTQVIGINNEPFKTSGFYTTATGTFGFTDYKGAFTSVSYPGTPFNQLLSQNDFGQAAGYYSTSSTGVPDTPYLYDEFGGVFEVFYIPGSTSAQATGVNNSSDVVGFFIDKDQNMHGWLKALGHFTQLDDPDGVGTTAALGLNNKGQVVGSYMDTSGNTHGFLYTVSSNSYQTIDDPDGIGMTIVNGINDKGDLVGFFGPQACGTNDCQGFVATPQ
jgi:probable HAF family extracellular repeat protein